MRCSRCNTEWPAEIAGKLKFCGACGVPMDSQPTSPLGTSSEPGGEVRYVNVVFADLAGFTAFAEDRPPDEVAQIVGDLLQSLGRIVEQYGGAIDKFLGDAVVAIFGWPNPDPEAARNAVRAGMAMQRAALSFNRERGFNFALRVGVHAGEAMFRVMGGSWTVMGDTVNTASRIQSAAAPGQVWISRAVYEEVRRFFTLAMQPAVELKGKKQAIQPYQVIEERDAPLVDMLHFVGRETEWDQLQSLLQKAIEEASLQVVVLRGVAGIGKSRLVWELRDWIQRQSTIYQVDMVQYDHSARLPSHGLNTMIRNRFNLPLALEDEAVLERLRAGVTEELTRVDPEREILAVEFFAFLTGILRPDFNIYDMDGKSKWDGAYAELKAWLEKHARRDPWIWFLEDAQKGDLDTANFVNWALHSDWHSPALIVITLREEDFTPASYWYSLLNRWLQAGEVTEIALREISPEVLSAALATMLEGAVPKELAQRIAEHTEGNPLFATELVLFLHERGLLDSHATWKHTDLPGSIREVMEARIERLGMDGKEVAKRGALMGRRFTRDAIERIWEKSNQEMDDGFDLLRKTEAIYEEASHFFSGEMEAVFRHGRLHEAVLARIPREERARWLQGLEKWARSRLQPVDENWERGGALLMPLIARSLEENGSGWQASLWYEVLGLLHSKFHRPQDAVQAYQKALYCAAGGDCSGSYTRRLVLAWQIAELEAYNGHGDEAIRILDLALADPESGAQPANEIPLEIMQRLEALITNPLTRWYKLENGEAYPILLLWRGNVLTQLARVAEAEQAYHETETRLRELPDSSTVHRIWLHWAKARAYLLSELKGDLEGAHRVFQEIRERIPFSDFELDPDRLVILSGEASVALNQGRNEETQRISVEWLHLAQVFNNHREQASAWNIQGICAHNVGNLELASQGYEHAVDLARSIGYRRGEVIGLYNLGLTYLDQADLERAERCINEYMAISHLTGNHLAECYGPYALASIALERGEYALAERLIEDTLQRAQAKNWQRLIELGHQSQAFLNFRRGIVQHAPAQLLCAVEKLSQLEQEVGTLEVEAYACWAISLGRLDRKTEGLALVQVARQKLDSSNPLYGQWLSLAESAISATSLQEVIDWFEMHNFQRAVHYVNWLKMI
jgi:class 3 adenylate cyclase/tetratricopeptide (TPR) repeat protein